MRSIFGLNYFVFCITALILILYCTRDMRDEGFEFAGVMTQLASTRAPRGCMREYFDDSGAIMQVAADSTGGAYGMFPELEPFANTFPQLEYSTSVNKVGRKVDKQIYDNLTIQGMSRMSPDSKYTPYHCPKGLME